MPADELSIILLAGGMGTRMRDLYPNLPKPMIPVAGHPFVEWVIRFWLSQGVHRVVLSLGYQAEAFREYLDARPQDGARTMAVSEPEPLGTGGAVRHAAAAAGCGDPFLVANVDSLVAADFSRLRQALDRPELDGLIVAVGVADASRYGQLDLGPDDRLLGFREKQPGRGWINAGIYLFRRRLLDSFPARTPLSLETEVLPSLLRGGAVIKVVPIEAPFLDIGTPETIAQAEQFVRDHLAQTG